MRLFRIVGLTAIWVAMCLSPLSATPEFAEQTGKTCSLCHEGPNGGPLTNTGIAFIRNGYDYPVPKRILQKAAVLRNVPHRTIRAILGQIHLITAAIFVGAIFFVHVFLKPSSLKGGIPRGEKRLGLSCMGILTVTGVYLTWYRLDAVSSFFESRFGLLLFIKLLLFVLLVAQGILAVTLINKKMHREFQNQGSDSLSAFDGKEGRSAHVGYDGKVYDVTESAKWKDGGHFAQHTAGTDLTDALADAPHGAEVLERFPEVEAGGATAGEGTENRSGPAQRVFVVMAYANLGLVILILVCVGAWLFDGPRLVSRTAFVGEPSGRAAAATSASAGSELECVTCHRSEKPALVVDWDRSVHALVGTTCADCHKAGEGTGTWVSAAHFEHTDVPVTPLVTPAVCARCHQEQVDQYARSKHANTLKIIRTVDNWLIHDMNNETERATGCYACHGTTVTVSNGAPAAGTWPNVGVGRANPDGTLGSCTSCHTRHRFSVVEARKPEACDQCHLGPDHPQIEIYNESKHGTMYHAYGDDWTWRPEDLRWTAGRDYRAPTCSACHMSETADLDATHDVGERLSWELQTPLTIRPSEFEPFPASADWRDARAKMTSVCLQCHSTAWTTGHFENMDDVIRLYNEEYYLPIAAIMDDLYARGALTADVYFDDELEWEYYELWHHEGRRARMGAAMMAPDYAWWHGFYECKHRFMAIVEAAESSPGMVPGEWADGFPGRVSE